MDIKKEEYIVKVELPGKEIEADINEELMDYSIDEPFEIAEAMSKQAIRYYRWADLVKHARKVVTVLEREFELWYALKIKQVREVLNRKEGNSRPTKDDLKNGITIYFNKSLTKWNNKIDKAKEDLETLEIVVKATTVKQNMLVSCGQLVSRLIDSGNMVVKDKRISKRREL